MARPTITNKQNDEFLRTLDSAVNEKDVENAYRRVLANYYDDGYTQISSPHNCDGYYSSYMFLRLLIEVKYEEDFLKHTIRCKTITQAIWYIKQFELSGEKLPNVVLIGDRNECFIVYGSHLYKYLEEDVDWTIAPSEAAAANNDFVMKLVSDKAICPFVFKINQKDFRMRDVCQAIDQLAQRGALNQVKLNSHNIRRIYDDFLRTVIGDYIRNYTTNDLVSIFILAMIDPVNCYIHPAKKNTLVVPNELREVQINSSSFYAFFSQFDRNYSPKECDLFTSMADVLIEETRRKMDGSFWTPSIWADYAVGMIENAIGKNWRKEYVVWDACCGSMNLTRDYKFDNLFLSTLYDTELSLGSSYNTNSTKFQYNFLEDDMDVSPDSKPESLKMPKALFQALCDNKPIVFYMNPPYGTANEAGAKGKSKAGIAKTAVNEKMVEDGMGKASQQLFAQFFYRILLLKKAFKLTNIVVAFFVKPIYMLGADYWDSFLKRFKEDFNYHSGILFNAADFSNVSDSWGVTFSIYKSKPEDKSIYPMKVVTIKDNDVVVIGEKNFREVPAAKSLSKWIREPLKKMKYKNLKKGTYPQFSSAFALSSSQRGSTFSESMGYFVNVANNIYKSSRDVFLLSYVAGMANGVNVTPENFERVCVTSTVRHLAPKNWINDKDEFCVPDENEETYPLFAYDCIVYSIFDPQSYMTSQIIRFKGVDFDIRNHWFFLPVDKMKEIANEESFSEMYNSSRTDENRYLYNLISDWKSKNLISDEASILLKEAEKIICESAKYRQTFHNESPLYQLDRWDAGWTQIKKLITAYPVKNMKPFSDANNSLADKIRAQIFTRGFLQE